MSYINNTQSIPILSRIDLSESASDATKLNNITDTNKIKDMFDGCHSIISNYVSKSSQEGIHSLCPELKTPKSKISCDNDNFITVLRELASRNGENSSPQSTKTSLRKDYSNLAGYSMRLVQLLDLFIQAQTNLYLADNERKTINVKLMTSAVERNAKSMIEAGEKSFAGTLSGAVIGGAIGAGSLGFSLKGSSEISMSAARLAQANAGSVAQIASSSGELAASHARSKGVNADNESRLFNRAADNESDNERATQKLRDTIRDIISQLLSMNQQTNSNAISQRA